jgi:hypothetical protein
VASADVMAITKWLISDSEECPDWVWDAGPVGLDLTSVALLRAGIGK